ncbi:MAG: hypothetical protein AAFV62_05250 [Pseudomonadota bacterium]
MSPGVAAVARAVAANPTQSFELTGRGDRVAIVSDGSRVLGLGNVGAEAALPVMEGKALLFQYLGAVDAAPLCVDLHKELELIGFVMAIAPSFGGINLEDIATPKCFRVLERLQAVSAIPVWHDDQQGTAAATYAGLKNALTVVGKSLGTIRIALIGIGAANFAVYRLLVAAGADPAKIIACDSVGTLHRHRRDIAEAPEALREKWRVCRETNPTGRQDADAPSPQLKRDGNRVGVGAGAHIGGWLWERCGAGHHIAHLFIEKRVAGTALHRSGEHPSSLVHADV